MQQGDANKIRNTKLKIRNVHRAFALYEVLLGVAIFAIGVVALGAATSTWQGAGVVLVAAGVLLVRKTKVHARAPEVLFGLPIAGCIAAYTLIDKHGIRYATPLAYLELSMIGPAVAYAAAIAGAKVSVTNKATGVTRDVTTDTAGFYSAPNLLPGPYEVTASASGFSTVNLISLPFTLPL